MGVGNGVQAKRTSSLAITACESRRSRSMAASSCQVRARFNPSAESLSRTARVTATCIHEVLLIIQILPVDRPDFACTFLIVITAIARSEAEHDGLVLPGARALQPLGRVAVMYRPRYRHLHARKFLRI